MPSPFPGMDPYLEQHWPDVRAGLIVYARDALQSLLPSSLCARIDWLRDAEAAPVTQ